MGYEIHLSIHEDSRPGKLISSLAAEQHITPSQAVEKLIDQVAERQTQAKDNADPIRIPGLPTEPLSADEAALVDEALAIVMEARRERAERLLGA